MFSYRLVKPSANYREAVIEKGGITAEFTLLEVEQMQERNRKALMELQGQLKIEEAKIDNINRHYPAVKDMPGVILTAAALYKESQSMIAELKPKIIQVDTAINENNIMVAEVMEQIKDLKSDGKKTRKTRKG
jgi:hypothetical protein